MKKIILSLMNLIFAGKEPTQKKDEPLLIFGFCFLLIVAIIAIYHKTYY